MTTPPVHPQGRGRPEWQPVLLLVFLAGALNLHGFELGFYFDDNNHLEQCRRNGFAGLADSYTFRWNRDLLRVWWAADETGWTYFRPLAVFLCTAALKLFGLDPTSFHVLHLALYTAVVVFGYRLLRRLELHQGPALIAGIFFLLHPVQGEVGPWFANNAAVLSALGFVLGLTAMHASHRSSHRRPILWIAVLTSYAVALLGRESGLMLGPVLLLFDWLLGGRTLRGRPWGLYALLAMEGVGYLILRTYCLAPGPLPREPYVHWPTNPGFSEWLPYKVLTDLASIPWGLPLVPVFGVMWFQDRPVATLVAVVAVIGAAALFVWPLRRSWAARGVLAGTALIALPTMPVFSAPYNYYTIAGGWAVVLALWARQVGPLRPRLVNACLAGLAAFYLAGHWASAWQFLAGAYAEDTVAAEIAADGAQDYPPRTMVFLTDLPLFATEVGAAVRLETGRSDLEFFPLTYAPQPYALRGETRIVVEDERTLLLSRSDDGWFAGSVGQELHLGWFGAKSTDLQPGVFAARSAAGDLPFRIEIVERTDRGIRALRFIFDRPLDDPSYRFFVGSPIRSTQPWRPSRPTMAACADPKLDRLNQRMRRMQIAADAFANGLSVFP